MFWYYKNGGNDLIRKKKNSSLVTQCHFTVSTFFYIHLNDRKNIFQTKSKRVKMVFKKYAPVS